MFRKELRLGHVEIVKSTDDFNALVSVSFFYYLNEEFNHLV